MFDKSRKLLTAHSSLLMAQARVISGLVKKTFQLCCRDDSIDRLTLVSVIINMTYSWCDKNTHKSSQLYFFYLTVVHNGGVATGVARGGRAPTLTVKNWPKIGKKGGKIRKNRRKIGKKEEKSGRKGKNREVSFTLPLLTDRAGYASDCAPLKGNCTSNH